MTPDLLLGAIRKRLFRPFVVLTGSGEKYPVDHPEQISISRSGRTVSIWLADEDLAIIDAAAIAGLVAGEGEGGDP